MPRPVKSMVVGTIVGDILMFAGVGWYLRHQAAAACVASGAQATMFECDADGVATPLWDLVSMPFGAFLLAAVVVAAFGSAVSVALAVRRGAPPTGMDGN